MLTVTQRAYTDAELDVYAERMGSKVASFTAVVTLGVLAGSLTFLAVLGTQWIYTLLAGGSSSWTLPLLCAGTVAGLTTLGLRFLFSEDDWTDRPPEQATEVRATAYAAWIVDDDGLESSVVLRVEPDRYLFLNEESLTLLAAERFIPGQPAKGIGSGIHAVLLGEGPFRIAIELAISGPSIPLKSADARPGVDDPDRDDETPLPDGLYTTAELPARIRRALSIT